MDTQQCMLSQTPEKLAVRVSDSSPKEPQSETTSPSRSQILIFRAELCKPEFDTAT